MDWFNKLTLGLLRLFRKGKKTVKTIAENADFTKAEADGETLGAEIKKKFRSLKDDIVRIASDTKATVVENLAAAYNAVVTAQRDITRYILIAIVATVVIYAIGFFISDSHPGAAAKILKACLLPIPIALLLACRRLGVVPFYGYLANKFAGNLAKRRAVNKPNPKSSVFGKLGDLLWGEDPFHLADIKHEGSALTLASLDTISDVTKDILKLISWTIGVYFLTWLILRYIGGNITDSWWFVSTVLASFGLSILLVIWHKYKLAVTTLIVFTAILVGLHTLAPKAFDAFVHKGNIYRENLALRIEQGNDTPILTPASNSITSPFREDSVAVKVSFSNVEGLADNYSRTISAVSGDSVLGTITFRQHVDTAFSTFWIKQNCEVKVQCYQGQDKRGKEARAYYFFAPPLPYQPSSTGSSDSLVTPPVADSSAVQPADSIEPTASTADSLKPLWTWKADSRSLENLGGAASKASSLQRAITNLPIGGQDNGLTKIVITGAIYGDPGCKCWMLRVRPDRGIIAFQAPRAQWLKSGGGLNGRPVQFCVDGSEDRPWFFGDRETEKIIDEEQKLRLDPRYHDWRDLPDGVWIPFTITLWVGPEKISVGGPLAKFSPFFPLTYQLVAVGYGETRLTMPSLSSGRISTISFEAQDAQVRDLEINVYPRG